MSDYKLGWHRGVLAAVWYEDGKRFRRSLGTDDPAVAKSRLIEFARARALAVSGAPLTVAAIYQAYVAERAVEGRSTTRMHDAWKRLAPAFGSLLPNHIDKATCRNYAAARRRQGMSDGTVHLELGYLRAAMKYAEREKWLTHAPYIPLPQKPPPREHYLTKDEATRVVDAAVMPHVKLFIELALATAGRSSAILQLTWARIDFEHGVVDLRDPTRPATRKGRSTPPMNNRLRARLLEARDGALTDYVVEWGGEPVVSVKKGVAAAGERAGIKVTPHVLRHTAAVWMAENEVPMDEIAQYLGHSDPRTTYRVYARFSPNYLRKAAGALEF